MKLDPVPTSQPLFADRAAFLGAVPDFAALTTPTSWPAGHFILMVLARSDDWNGPALVSWAQGAIQAGAAYACCWGPGCDKMETCFDEAAVSIELASGHERPVILTTSHRDEPLEEALWFAATATWPAEEYSHDCHSLVVIAVGDPSWAEEARSYLAAGAPLRDKV